jgi:hypothetical protein
MYSVPPANFIYCSTRFRFGSATTWETTSPAEVLASSSPRMNERSPSSRIAMSLIQGTTSPTCMSLVEHRILGKTKQGDTYELLIDPGQAPLFPDKLEDDVACIVDPRCKSLSARADVFHHFGIEALADTCFFSENLYPGEQVFYAGFPDPHDKLAQRPILRSGTIASDPRHPYSNTGQDEGARVAYEAFSSGGASGSPVWAAARSFQNYPGSRTGAVVGVNGGHIEGKFGAHSGISFFYKSSVLLELLRKAGVVANAA